MFNQLTPADVVRALGSILRASARADHASSAFERDQLMSAYSSTRHLRVELAEYPPVWAAFRLEVADVIAEHPTTVSEALAPAAQAVAAALEPPAMGDALCALLAGLRESESPEAIALQRELRRSLRELADREVELVADGLS